MRSIWIRSLGFLGFLSASGWAQVTQRVSLDSAGVQGNGFSSIALGIEYANSGDGRYVAYWSFADNLVPGDTNGVEDVFLRDRETGVTERLSVDANGVQGNGGSLDPTITSDGRYVVFESIASNLVPGDTNGSFDIFVVDLQAGTIERASVGTGGVQADNHSLDSSVSDDGRYVTFSSQATNLVAGDTNGVADIFVRDRQAGTTERVSLDSDEQEGNGACGLPSISGDGRCVAFESSATDLVAGDANGVADIFVRDLQEGTTERVSVDSGGAQADGASALPSISGDGRFVVFESSATDLVPDDTNERLDVFLRDRQALTTERMSVASDEEEGDADSLHASVSGDGAYVVFTSSATNLVPGDTNAAADEFLRRRPAGTTERVSVDSAGRQANSVSGDATISRDGRFVAFASLADNLVPTDTNGQWDVFLHDRFGEASFHSVCLPGSDGVLECPCSNPPGSPGRGCENSEGTGGAMLAASGGTFLSSDSLVFTTSGQRSTALSLVMQGNDSIAGGIVFGQGVRCVGGSIIRRLYVKSATAGSITAPDFGAGDPAVAARSASKGDVIQAGESRWYLVFYRDPVILGDCPAHHTFNATQTGVVTWQP